MHTEAREELRVRLKLVVLELANHFGVTESCRECNVPRSSFYRWKQKYDNEDEPDCIEKDPPPIAIPAGHRWKWWRKSWQSEQSINSEPYRSCITWTAITGSRYQNPR